MNGEKQELRVEGRVEMHLPGGVSKIAVKLGGSRTIDIPTNEIPEHLRGLGSRLLLIFKQSDEIVRAPSGEEAHTYDGIVIKDLPLDAEFGWFPESR